VGCLHGLGDLGHVTISPTLPVQ